MPTKEPRLNVVLDKPTREAVAAIATLRETTLSKVVAGFIQDQLDVEEDKYWSGLVEARRKDKQQPLAHDAFWKLAAKKIKK